ncbi:hypothetical protein EDD16DRAFT_1757799 [Pisolithus croceorrhizus]|nr:hypothetical protein EDD16DRAFT_1757799 [Pisolithus croceorrhizus]
MPHLVPGPHRHDPKSHAQSHEYLKQCLQEISYLTSPQAMNPLPNCPLITNPNTAIGPIVNFGKRESGERPRGPPVGSQFDPRELESCLAESKRVVKGVKMCPKFPKESQGSSNEQLAKERYYSEALSMYSVLKVCMWAYGGSPPYTVLNPNSESGAGVNPSGGAPVVSSGPGVTSPQTFALPQPGQAQGSFESIYNGQPRKQLLEMNAMGQEVKPSLEHPASLSSINGNRIEVWGHSSHK